MISLGILHSNELKRYSFYLKNECDIYASSLYISSTIQDVFPIKSSLYIGNVYIDCEYKNTKRVQLLVDRITSCNQMAIHNISELNLSNTEIKNISLHCLTTINCKNTDLDTVSLNDNISFDISTLYRYNIKKIILSNAYYIKHKKIIDAYCTLTKCKQDIKI